MGDADLVFQSYGRACNNPSFFEEFYSNFMSQSPDIRAMFVNTNMAAQRSLLRGGVLWLIMHARGMSDAKIRALGESHSKKNMNINPMFYGLWLDALISTLKVYDPEFTPELEICWRSTLRPSIEMIQDMYDK